MSTLDLRDRLMPRLSLSQPSTSAPRHPLAPPQDDQPPLIITEGTNALTLTTPVETLPSEQAASDMAKRLFLKLRGRFVEAEKANGNGAFWSARDLEIGLPTVAGGPLNWLHEERTIVGALTSATLVNAATDEREAARSFSAEERRKLAASGKAMSDGSFPIATVEDLKNAIRLAHTPAQRRHVIRRARALGATGLIPDSWKREKASAELGPYIQADAVLWRWLYADKARVVERAADEKKLWYSMECVSPEVACVGERGCGATVPYLDALRRDGQACAHMRERSAQRRFVNPVFQGGAIIVPPITPGWANADLTVVREAAAQVESASPKAFEHFREEEAMSMVQQILEFAGR